MMFINHTFWISLFIFIVSSQGLKQNEVAQVKITYPETPDFEQQKQNKVERAKLAQEVGRFGTMAKAMKQATEMAIKYGLQVNTEDQYLMEFAYQVIVDARRSSLGYIYTQVQDQHHADFSLETVQEMREEIEMEVQIICEDLVRLTELVLKQEKNEPSKVFWYTMKGNYHRYMSEVKSGKELDAEATHALNSYATAYDKAKYIMQATNPIRIGLAIKLAVLYNDVFKSAQHAYDVSQEAVKAVDDQLEEDRGKEEDMSEEARQSLALLRKNMELLKPKINQQGASNQIEHQGNTK